MKKILYNTKYGGFGFSDELLQMFGITDGQYGTNGLEFCHNLSNRTNPLVIAAVERIGLEKASGECCKLAIEEIGDDDIYVIEEFDGKERLLFVCRAKNNLVY